MHAAEATPHSARRTIAVFATQLALADSADGRLGFRLRPTTEIGASEQKAPFVAARTIRRRLRARTLTIGFTLADLPPDVANVEAGSIEHGQRADVFVGSWSRGLIAAWAVNVALLWGSCLTLAYIVVVRSMLAQKLQGSARDDEQWWSDFFSALGMNFFYSIFVVDVIKVFCLTLTSKAFLRVLAPPMSTEGDQASLSKGRCSSLGGLFKRMLRRAHKVFDWLY